MEKTQKLIFVVLISAIILLSGCAWSFDVKKKEDHPLTATGQSANEELKTPLKVSKPLTIKPNPEEIIVTEEEVVGDLDLGDDIDEAVKELEIVR